MSTASQDNKSTTDVFDKTQRLWLKEQIKKVTSASRLMNSTRKVKCPIECRKIYSSAYDIWPCGSVVQAATYLCSVTAYLRGRQHLKLRKEQDGTRDVSPEEFKKYVEDYALPYVRSLMRPES